MSTCAGGGGRSTKPQCRALRRVLPRLSVCVSCPCPHSSQSQRGWQTGRELGRLAPPVPLPGHPMLTQERPDLPLQTPYPRPWMARPRPSPPSREPVRGGPFLEPTGRGTVLQVTGTVSGQEKAQESDSTCLGMFIAIWHHGDIFIVFYKSLCQDSLGEALVLAWSLRSEYLKVQVLQRQL